MKIDPLIVLTIALASIVVTGCSKETPPCPSPRAAPSIVAIVPAALPPVAPPQAVSISDAKRVFAAHDCCDRYINTDVYRVGALRARGRIFTVFHLTFINPESEHGTEHVAILDGLRLLGTYEVYATHERLDGSRIVFECDWRERERNAEECTKSIFQGIDLSEPQLPKMRVIYGQTAELRDSI